MPPTRKAPTSIRAAYVQSGVDNFYRTEGATYRNPQEPAIARLLQHVAREWNLDLACVLDLAAGSGEVTLALRPLNPGAIHAMDPFTFEAYRDRTGQAAERISFEQIAAGALRDRRFTLIVCSFAMHLVSPSRLPDLCLELATLSPALLILTPHKRPILRPSWGWTQQAEHTQQRVRARLHHSILFTR